MLEAPEDDESEAELSDNEIEKRREQLRKRILVKQEDEEALEKEEERKSDSEASVSSEYEEYTDSEEETGTCVFSMKIFLTLIILSYGHKVN